MFVPIMSWGQKWHPLGGKAHIEYTYPFSKKQTKHSPGKRTLSLEEEKGQVLKPTLMCAYA